MVDEEASRSGEELLRLGVRVGLTVGGNMLLVRLRSLGNGLMIRNQLPQLQWQGLATDLVGCSGGNQLMGQFGLVRGASDLYVDRTSVICAVAPSVKIAHLVVGLGLIGLGVVEETHIALSESIEGGRGG
jgi:hypothetical protein